MDPNPKSRIPAFLALLGAFAGLACSTPQGGNPEQAPEPEPTRGVAHMILPTPAFAKAGGGTVIADVAESSVSGVVNISSQKIVRSPQSRSPFFSDPFFREFFGQRYREVPRERREQSLGSGVIVSKDGVVLTNNHVIDQADIIKVTLADGREFDAEVVGKDPDTDIAVLRLKGKPENLHPLGFGDSSSLRLGDIVLAIGNPFGVGQTVTMGIVSAKGRADVGIVDYEDFIQTDAAINPGNSGGALVDANGRLVGINTAILSRSGGYQGIGFAIPSNMAKAIMESLLREGTVRRGWLGASIQDIDKNLAEALGLATTQGVLVAGVEPNGPADAAGLRVGDVIVDVNGTKTTSTGRLRNSIAVAGAGAAIALKVLRGDTQLDVTIQLGSQDDGLTRARIDEDEGALGGLTLGTLSKENRQRYRVVPNLRHGVVVTEVNAGSPAAHAGFRAGDVIREINRRPVRSVPEFRKLYEGARGTVAVLVQRGPYTMFVALRK